MALGRSTGGMWVIGRRTGRRRKDTGQQASVSPHDTSGATIRSCNRYSAAQLSSLLRSISCSETLSLLRPPSHSSRAESIGQPPRSWPRRLANQAEDLWLVTGNVSVGAELVREVPGDDVVVLQDGTRIPVSRRFRTVVRRRLRIGEG